MKQRVSPATVTIGMVAIVCGLVAAYVARRYFEAPPPADNRVAVVVPRYNLPKYSRLRERDLVVVRFAPDEVPAGAITAPERVFYRTARETILAGVPIREEDLYPVGETPTLSEQLPPGMVAVTIAVDRINALGGLLVPESTVDIALTLSSEDPRIRGLNTKTIMKNVRVLATSEQRYPSEERDPPTFRHVTVAVTPDEANQLVLAQRHGTLSIALRSDADRTGEGRRPQPGEEDFVNLETLLGLGPLPPSARPMPIEIWRGTMKSEVQFGGEEQGTNATASSRGPSSPTTQVANSPRTDLAATDPALRLMQGI